MWRPRDLGDEFARRELHVLRAGVVVGVATLVVGRPVRSPEPTEGDPWWCPTLVTGIGADSFTPVAGEDSLQALTLALDFLRHTVSARAASHGLSVEWLGPTEDAVFRHLDYAHEQFRGTLEALNALLEAIELADAEPTIHRRSRLDELRQYAACIVGEGDQATT